MVHLTRRICATARILRDAGFLDDAKFCVALARSVDPTRHAERVACPPLADSSQKIAGNWPCVGSSI